MKRTILMACAMVTILGCNDDEDQPSLDGSVMGTLDAATPDAASPMDASTPVLAPAYLAATRTFSAADGNPTTYVKVLPSIESGVKLDVATSTELPGAAELFQIPSLGWFGIGDGETPVLAQYTLGADNKLTRGKEINLSTYGLTDFFADDLYYVSPTKVYYPDPNGKQLLIINPSEMKIAGTVALPQTSRDGYTSVYSYASVTRGSKLLFTVAWFDWKNDKVLNETGLVVLDTTTDTVTVQSDTRCAGITQPITTGNGDAYFVSSALAGALYQLKRHPSEPCALRVLAGAESFDGSYDYKLGQATNGAIAGEPIPDTGDSIFLRVLDASKLTIKPETASYEVTGQPDWGWVRWNVKTNAVTPVTGIEPSASDAYFFQVGERTFVSQAKADFSSTQLIELNAAGGAKPAMNSEGFFSALLKIR